VVAAFDLFVLSDTLMRAERHNVGKNTRLILKKEEIHE